MRFQIVTTPAEHITTDCVVIGMTDKGLGIDGKRLNRLSQGKIQRAIKQADMKGKTGKTLMLYNLDGIKAPGILIVGCGENNKRDGKTWLKILSAIYHSLAASHCKSTVICLHNIKVKGRHEDWCLQEAAHYLINASHKVGEMKSRKLVPDALKTIKFTRDRNTAAYKKALDTGIAIGNGVVMARRLGDLPASVCTPSYLARKARTLAKKSSHLRATILSEAQMKKLDMHALLSVSAGSDEPARLIILEYCGSKKQDKPVALVGKGVTFDTGGISIKPAASMDEMKYDMCGAASVLGTISAISEMKLPINVVGVIPATENMPSGHATKPGDIVTSMSGQTIEILNTDAEGRLILCDALTYVQKFKPSAIIDIATLTGAVIVALGHHHHGLMGNDEKLANEILAAGIEAEDTAWRLPISDEYDKQLDSNFADMANIGGRSAGTITAACFLSRFIKDTCWAHLDIAGTAWRSGGKSKGATGRPVALLTRFLINHCQTSR